MRQAGVRVALPQSTLDAAQVFVPGLFVVLVTWLGARFALSGKIDAGDLVAFYGYAAFLVLPLRTAAEAVDKLTRAYVGARRMLGDPRRSSAHVAEPERARSPSPPSVVAARRRTLRASSSSPGRLIGLVSALPDEAAAIADRLGRFGDDDGVVLGDVPLAELSTRRRAPQDRRQRGRPAPLLRARCAASSTPGDASTATTRRSTRRSRSRTPRTSSTALPEGLDADVDERGRSFSGGQRQRLVLARALLSDAEVLVLVEPTSAVDAHTEARIARRLREARAGQDDRRDHGEPADARPDRPRRLRRGRARRRRGHAPRAAADRAGPTRWTVTRGEDL